MIAVMNVISFWYWWLGGRWSPQHSSEATLAPCNGLLLARSTMPAICNENNLLCLLLVISSALHWHDIVLYKARWGGVACPGVAMWVVGGLRTLNQRESPTVNSPWPFPVKTLPAKEASTVQDRIVLFLCSAFWDFRGLCWDLWRPRLERKLSSWVHWAWSYNRHSISSMLGLGDLHTSRNLLQNAKSALLLFHFLISLQTELPKSLCGDGDVSASICFPMMSTSIIGPLELTTHSGCCKRGAGDWY